MIRCIVCGRALRSTDGQVQAVLDAYVGACVKPCLPVLAARVRRLLEQVEGEFAAGRDGRAAPPEQLSPEERAELARRRVDLKPELRL